MPDSVGQVFEQLIRRMQEPLGLAHWQIAVESGPDLEATAGCAAQPEYEKAIISVDPDKLQTGDELDETAAHELAHCHTWAISHLADDLCVLACELLPEPHIAPWAKMLKASVERAEEFTTTQVGRTYIRLLRRLWDAETEIKALRAEVKALKKTA